MRIDVGGAQIFSVAVMAFSALIGMWTKRVQTDQHDNAEQIVQIKAQLAALREQLAREASDYARRADMEEMVRRIEQKLDRMTDKLDSKQDKHT